MAKLAKEQKIEIYEKRLNVETRKSSTNEEKIKGL